MFSTFQYPVNIVLLLLSMCIKVPAGMLKSCHLSILSCCVCVDSAETYWKLTRVPSSVLFHFPSLRWQWKTELHNVLPCYCRLIIHLNNKACLTQCNSIRPTFVLQSKCMHYLQAVSILTGHNKEASLSSHTILLKEFVKLPVATKLSLKVFVSCQQGYCMHCDFLT